MVSVLSLKSSRRKLMILPPGAGGARNRRARSCELLPTVVEQVFIRQGCSRPPLMRLLWRLGLVLLGSLVGGGHDCQGVGETLADPLGGGGSHSGAFGGGASEPCRGAYPLVGLVASGGHSHYYLMQAPGQGTLLGGTIDDAAGEAFDKAAAILELGYPGGPLIDRLAASGDPTAVDLPRPF